MKTLSRNTSERFIRIVFINCSREDEALDRTKWKEQIRKADPTRGIIILWRQKREDREITYGLTYDIIFSIK